MPNYNLVRQNAVVHVEYMDSMLINWSPMQNTLKSSLPALTILIFGMMGFVLISAAAPLISFPPSLNRLVFAIIMIVIILAMSLFCIRIEKTSLASMNLVPDMKSMGRFVLGFLIGSMIVGSMLLALFSLTALSLERESSQQLTPFLVAALIYIPLAFMEELLFRGYPFFRLKQLFNIRWVILITAVLFGLYHLNESNSLYSVLLGPGVWGVVFGVAAYLSNSVALPLGIHVAANGMQAYFGMKDSLPGMWEIKTPDVSLSIGSDPDALGLIMQVCLLLVSIVVLEWAIRRKQRSTI